MSVSRAWLTPPCQPLKSSIMKEVVPEWDANFVDELDQEMLFELILVRQRDVAALGQHSPRPCADRPDDRRPTTWTSSPSLTSLAPRSPA